VTIAVDDDDDDGFMLVVLVLFSWVGLGKVKVYDFLSKDAVDDGDDGRVVFEGVAAGRRVDDVGVEESVLAVLVVCHS
jgi:hypothetical protein